MTIFEDPYITEKLFLNTTGHDTTRHDSTYIHTYIHTYMHTYMHTYIHTYIHTYYIHGQTMRRIETRHARRVERAILSLVEPQVLYKDA